MNKLKITAGGGLVLNEKNELLMIFRRGKWDLPKGKIDAGETIEECAVREVQEETGLKKVTLGKPIGITVHEYFDDRFTHENVVKETHWFFMQVNNSPKLIPQKEEDIENAIWCNQTQIKSNLENSYPTILEIIEKGNLL